MKLTALTCTCDRPEAFALCEKYVRRQTWRPDQWLVLDDGTVPANCTMGQQHIHNPEWRGRESMVKKVLHAIEGGLITGDCLMFVEDDDAFKPEWFAWVMDKLRRYDMAGQGSAFYYHVGKRWWSDCKNIRHASLCQTAVTRELFEPIVNICREFSSPFFDTRLWTIECNKFLHLPKPSERLLVGIKGMPGLRGYSGEHKQNIPPNVNIDPAMLKLWELIGADAAAYLPFYQK